MKKEAGQRSGDFEEYSEQKNKSFLMVLKLLKFAAKNSPFYKKLFKENRINVNRIKNYEDFKKIPFTTPQDLKKHNSEFRALPLKEIWQIFSTSGTTGEPKFYFYDRKRLKILGAISKTVLKRVEIDNLDDLMAAVFFPLDSLSGGGPIAVRTCEALGVPVTGFGISPPAEVVAGRLRRLKPNWFYIFPTTFSRLTQELKQINFDPNEVDVKVMFSSGEPLGQNSRKIIQDFFKPKHIVDLLASVEIAAYIASECKQHKGLHFLPFSVFPEVIDLDSGGLIEEGVGELVVSSIEAYGTPMFRYKTGDIIKLSKEKCLCGRSLPRIWVLGRVDERINLQGGRKFYATIETNKFIEKYPVLTQNYQYLVDKFAEKDSIKLRIESNNLDKSLAEKIRKELIGFSNPLSLANSQNMLNFEVELIPLNSLERVRGKIKDRIVDSRKI